MYNCTQVSEVNQELAGTPVNKNWSSLYVCYCKNRICGILIGKRKENKPQRNEDSCRIGVENEGMR